MKPVKDTQLIDTPRRGRCLSKSRYVLGLQCLKALWLSTHHKEQGEKPDETMEWVFEQGHRVGRLAHKLFPDGVLIAEDHEHIAGAIDSTVAARSAGASAMFEATVSHRNVLCRADILKRVPGNRELWDLYEVKSGTGVKPQHIPDIAIQRYCLEGAGYRIRRAFLMHINREYERDGDIEPDKLFIAQDQTEQAVEHEREIETNLKKQFAALAGATPPRVAPGPQCEGPYRCAFFDICNKPLPAGSVEELARGYKLVPLLKEAGVTKLADIPFDTFSLNAAQQAQVKSARARKAVIDKEQIARFLKSISYPLYYLDFETVACAVPLFNRTRPWQNVPFQYSLHVQAKPGGRCSHVEFLASDRRDPRPDLCGHLLEHLGTGGTILAWNISFEKSVISELAFLYPRYSRALSATLARFVDLIVPFRNGWYADRRFCGSASLKAVAPVIAPHCAYDGLEIAEGATASTRAARFFSGDMDTVEWRTQRKHLLKYCGQDTVAMVEILKKLYEVTI